jgi:Rrf2 family protein
MLKLTKKADYGLIALRHLASQTKTASAKEIAESYRIPLPLLSKVLQKLVRDGMLVSEQGATGGYRLSRDSHDINALEVIRSIDGPIILTHCFTEHEGHECDQSSLCPVREPLRKVHEGILRLLSSITIADMSSDDMPIPAIQQMVSSIQPSSLNQTRLNSGTR